MQTPSTPRVALAALLIAFASPLAAAAERPTAARPFVSPEVRAVVAWVERAGDAGGRPFLVVDKHHATLVVFSADARPIASSPILLGLARGDDSVPGIGERPMAAILPHERTTPAGRFVGEPGKNLQGEEIVWVDYDAAVSMHRVRATNPRERRLERLATPTVEDNRISYGCINVPAAFFDAQVAPIFRQGARAMIYVLPEIRSLRHVFGPGVDAPRAGPVAMREVAAGR